MLELVDLRIDRIEKPKQDRQLDHHRKAAGERIDAVLFVERHRCRLQFLGFALVLRLEGLEQRLHFLHLRHRFELLLGQRKERRPHDQRQQDHVEPVRRDDRMNGVEHAQHRIGDRLEEIKGEHGARNLSEVVAIGQRGRSPIRYGTGSKPPACQGAHRTMRRTARNTPRSGPCFSIAAAAYSEHVGTKRQAGGSIGESSRL